MTRILTHMDLRPLACNEERRAKSPGAIDSAPATIVAYPL